MSNREIKIAALDAGVKLWQVAEALGIADTSLSRKMRHELPAEEKEKALAAIRNLKEARNES